jgi:hypothetical protein
MLISKHKHIKRGDVFMKSINIFIVYFCLLITDITYISAAASQTISLTDMSSGTPPAPPATPAAAATPAPTVTPPTVTPPTTPTTPPSVATAPAQPTGDTIAANWAAAITAFGGSAGITAKTASKTMPSTMTATSVGYADAQVIMQFLNDAPLNVTDSATLTAQLAINLTTPAATPTPPTATTPAPAPAPTATTPAPAPTTPATTATTATPAVPILDVKAQQVLISVYIQNNFEQDAMLNKIELLLANQTAPLIKSNLKIPVKAAQNIYSKGSITAFDLTAEANSVQSFNGIQSITINDDQIVFNNVKTGSSLSNPIAITKKDGHWVIDKQL